MIKKIRLCDVVLAAVICVPLVVCKVDASKRTSNDNEVSVECTTETVTEQADIVYKSSNVKVDAVYGGNEMVELPISEQQAIKNICERNGLSYELMMAIAMQESSFDKSAYNPVSGDYGLFQINSKTWEIEAINLGFDEYKTNYIHNTEMACYVMNECFDLADGDLRVALNYYRTGTPHNKYEADSDYASIVIDNLIKIQEADK